MMILATAVMLPNSIVRLLEALHVGSINHTTVLIFDALILAVVINDTIRHRQLHPAFGWGASAAIGAERLRTAGRLTPTVLRQVRPQYPALSRHGARARRDSAV